MPIEVKQPLPSRAEGNGKTGTRITAPEERRGVKKAIGGPESTRNAKVSKAKGRGAKGG